MASKTILNSCAFMTKNYLRNILVRINAMRELKKPNGILIENMMEKTRN